MVSYKDIDPNGDVVEVAGVLLAAWGITLSDAELVLKIVSLILAIAFTGYKFRNEIRKNRKARKEETQAKEETDNNNTKNSQ